MEENHYRCPVCNHGDLTLRYEASYVYSYALDKDAPGHKNSEEFLSYLYDKREQTNSRTFIECNYCKAQYPYSFINGVLEEGRREGIYKA